MHSVMCLCEFTMQILPPGLETALASLRPQGKALTGRAQRILDTYGAETDITNKLSSNNQIIHVSESNNGGMRAEVHGRDLS